MSFTFHNNPKERTIDAVRTELGDTIQESSLIDDEMIEYCLEQETDDVLLAAARAAELTGAKFAREEVVRHNGVAIDKSAAMRHFSDLANNLRMRISGSGEFIMNTRSSAQHRDNEKNPSSTHGAFRRGMFSHRPLGFVNPETE